MGSHALSRAILAPPQAAERIRRIVEDKFQAIELDSEG